MHDTPSFILTFGAIYGAFFCLLLLTKKKNANRLILQNISLCQSPLLLLLHGAGIIVFGVVPFWKNHPTSFPVFDNNSTPLSTAVCLLLVVLMLFVSPRMAAKTHSTRDNTCMSGMPAPLFLQVYFCLRVVFIIIYEWWFRGLLLAGTIGLWGVPVAVCLNVISYAVLHIVNGKKEMVGCVPFGLLLCGLCLWQGAVWPAILLHLALTIPYEITLLNKIKTINRTYENLSHRRIGLHRA